MSQNEPTTTTTTTNDSADVAMRRFRERVTATLSLIVILGTVIMMGLAVLYISNPDQFGRVKDLLLFVNPLLGVVIGYYFNKTSTEARAESAENTAKSATAAAQQAIDGHNVAKADADAAKADAAQAHATLSALSDAAEKVLSAAPGTPGTMIPTESGGASSDDARMALRLALERAKAMR